ncbi:MAG: DNA polymerase III subunit gamma/tau [Acidobacteriales bacterium]|nr:DNA polymerase III subunit gamma/tau [Terriglobales bacterium]
MYQVIARKYRPQAFSELVSQEHVRATLENAIAQGRIAHGYIFSGQRGTGKTTVARIVARCLNCVQGPTTTPCGVCASCREIAEGGAVDVIEIDAASNRGINEMRELRENVRYRPARDRYKVFIIDEAHQITNEAFNALLKTLEEPPEWAVFILCTTESHKIPATIASRCQHFSFRSVDFEDLVARMKWICEQEGVEADADVLAILAQAGDGSVRDSLSALDQAIACCGNKLNAAEVRALLGRFSVDLLEQVTQALVASDSRRMLDIVAELDRNGLNLQHFSRELSRYLRNLLVAKVAGAETRLIAASPAERERLVSIAGGFSEEDLTRYLQLSLDLFRDLQYSLQPRLHLELGLLRMVHAGRLVSIEDALAGLGPAPAAPAAPAAPSPSAAPRSAPVAPPARSAPVATPAQSTPAPAQSRASDGSLKERLYQALIGMGAQFTADAIEVSEVSEQGNLIAITTPREFALPMRGNDVQKALERLFERPPHVKVTLTDEAPATASMAKPTDETTQRTLEHPAVKRFQEVFPGSHVRTVRDLRDT